jgi:hypothetical protein
MAEQIFATVAAGEGYDRERHIEALQALPHPSGRASEQRTLSLAATLIGATAPGDGDASLRPRLKARVCAPGRPSGRTCRLVLRSAESALWAHAGPALRSCEALRRVLEAASAFISAR